MNDFLKEIKQGSEWISNNIYMTYNALCLIKLSHLLHNELRISNECRFNTEFIEGVEKKYIMRASGEHNIILFNEFNKFSNEPA